VLTGISATASPSVRKMRSITFGSTLSCYGYHHQSKWADSVAETYGYLCAQMPADSSYENYYEVACALYELDRVDEAQKMFEQIAHSEIAGYAHGVTYASDIPGDTSSNIYGYGSFKLNYKSSAHTYLCKIFLEKQQYLAALVHYKLTQGANACQYNCGTGAMMKHAEDLCLEASCYQGLGEYRKVLDLLMPKCLERSEDISIRSIRALYTQEEINTAIQYAERTILVWQDSFAVTTTKNYYKGNGKLVEGVPVIYYPTSAAFTLFGYTAVLKLSDAQHPEIGNIEEMLKLFRETNFYEHLMNAN
jgi:tetratricopeptide (TPR) repeat protein